MIQGNARSAVDLGTYRRQFLITERLSLTAISRFVRQSMSVGLDVVVNPDLQSPEEPFPLLNISFPVE